MNFGDEANDKGIQHFRTRSSGQYMGVSAKAIGSGGNAKEYIRGDNDPNDSHLDWASFIKLGNLRAGKKELMKARKLYMISQFDER